MRIAVFFVYLFSLLSSGDTNAYTGKHDYSFGQHLNNRQTQQNTTIQLALVADESIIITDHTEPSVEKQDIINDDVEDDDTSNSLAGKSRLPGRCHSPGYAANPPPSDLNYLCNYFTDPPYYLGQATHKYILQGVLRI